MTRDSQRLSTNAPIDPIRAWIANALYYLGWLGLPLVLGIILGFYLSERGVRWLPTTLEILLGLTTLCLASIVAGRLNHQATIVIVTTCHDILRALPEMSDQAWGN